MKRSLIVFIAVLLCLLSVCGCRELSPIPSSAEGVSVQTTADTAVTEKEITATTAEPVTTAPTTVQTTRKTTSHPVIKMTTAKTTAKPVTTVKVTAKPTVKPTVPPAVGNPDGVQKQVFDLVNQYRAQNGKPALIYREDVEGCADLRAQEIIQLFEHTRPNGSECFTVLDEAGVSYRGAGENIAYGHRSAEEVMTGWIDSPGHKENILRPEFTGIAVGHAERNGVHYWVQLFIL